MDIISEIEEVYDRGKMTYFLSKYIDRDFWTLKFKESFTDKYIFNATDFTHSKCFTLYINLSNINAGIHSKEFYEYVIENKKAYGCIVEISILAPVAVLKYSKYYVEETLKCKWSSIPYREGDREFHNKIKDFIGQLGKLKIDLLKDRALMKEVPGKSLEVKKAPVSVYNCFFQDNYDYYPYLNK